VDKVSEDRRLRQRAFYYTHIFADPKNRDTLYVLKPGFYKSTDGGKTYRNYVRDMVTITTCGSIRTIRSA
jgi:hypothetical protein